MATLYTIHAPVYASPQDLNRRVDAVVAKIEVSGKWRVVSYNVTSGAQISVLPPIPSWLIPSVQVVKFVVSRPDDLASTQSALAVVYASAAATNLNLGYFGDWLVESKQAVSDAVFGPDDPKDKKKCSVANLSACFPTKVKVTVGVALGVFVLAQVASLGRTLRAFAPRRRRR